MVSNISAHFCFQGVLCPGPAQVPELLVLSLLASAKDLNQSLNHWCLRTRKKRRRMMSQSWNCCHWGVSAGCSSLQRWASPLWREQMVLWRREKRTKLLTYLMKEKQEIENQDIKKVPVVHMNSPLGFAGFLTELSCPLTSCSLLSSSLLFSRVSSSLDLPTLPFFPAVHEKMTKDVTDLESTWRCIACSVQGHIETKSGIEANSAEPRGRNKSAEYFLRLHLTDISHWRLICYFVITWLAVCYINSQEWWKKLMVTVSLSSACRPRMSHFVHNS